MADVTIQNTLSSRNAHRRSRYEKNEVAFGKILGADYTNGDILHFDNIPSKDVIHGRFVTSSGAILEIFYGANYDNPITWDITSGDDISYVVHYIRGTGLVRDGVRTAGEGVSIQIVTS